MAVVFVATAIAQDRYGFVTFKTADGVEQSLPAMGLSITFKDGQLLAVNGGHSATIPLSDISSMFFSYTATGITAPEKNAVKVRVVDGKLQIDAPAGSRVSVFTPDGRLVGTENLTKGIYVVRVNEQTFKIVSE